MEEFQQWSKMSCFFCLRNPKEQINSELDIDFPGDGNVGSGSLTTVYDVSLRNIYRFLYSPHRDLNVDDQYHHLRIPVPACGNCLKLTGEFNDLYNLWEETKLRLNWCVQKLQDVMTHTENDCWSSNNFTMNEENDGKMRRLRADTMDLMKSVCPLPRVVLHDLKGKKKQHPTVVPGTIGQKHFEMNNYDDDDPDRLMDTQDISSPSSLSGSIDQHPFNIIIKTEVIEEENECLSEAQAQPTIKMEAYPENPSILEEDTKPKADEQIILEINDDFDMPMETESQVEPEPPQPLPMISDSESNSRPQCTYCGEVINNMKSYFMEMHQIQYHPEHFFPEEWEKASLAGLNPEQFHGILANEILPEFFLKAGDYTSCSLCIQVFNKSSVTNRNMMHQHLVLKHKSRVRRRLKKNILKKFPTLEESPCTSIPMVSNQSADIGNNGTETESPPSECHYCDFTFTGESSLEVWHLVEMHQIRFHPEHYFPEERFRASGLSLVQFQRILKECLFPQFISKVGRIRQCTLCDVKYNGKNSDSNYLEIQKHLIYKHNADLRKRLKAILEHPLVENSLDSCGTMEMPIKVD